MPRVKGKLSTITERPSSIREVWIRPPSTRPRGEGLIVDEPVRVIVNETGEFTATIAPGAGVLLLIGPAGMTREAIPLLVRDDTSTLRQAVEEAQFFKPETHDRLAELANETAENLAAARSLRADTDSAAQKMREAAKALESSVKKTVSESTEGIKAGAADVLSQIQESQRAAKASEDAANQASQQASQSEKSAGGYASEAHKHAGEAGVAQRAAEAARDKALASEQAAGEHVKAAAQSVEQAAIHEQGAKAGMEDALSKTREAQAGAEKARDSAVEARSGAEKARDEAKRAAGEAADKVRAETEESAQKATVEANRAEQAAEAAAVGIKPDSVQKAMLSVDLRSEIDAKADKAVVEKQLAGKASSADVDRKIGEIPKPTWGTLGGKPSDFKPASHTHTTKDITGLDEALKAKADLSVVDEKIRAIPKPVSTWAELQGKPTKFPPESHKHKITDVTGLQGVLDEKTTKAYVDGKIRSLPKPATSWSEIAGKPSDFRPKSHTHSIREVSGLDAALQNKASGLDMDRLKSEVAALRTQIPAKRIEVVSELPSSQDPNVIYFEEA